MNTASFFQFIYWPPAWILLAHTMNLNIFITTRQLYRDPLVNQWRSVVFGFILDTLLPFVRFNLSQLIGPDFVVDVLAEEVEAKSECQNHNEKHNALWKVEHIEHRIHPFSRYGFDDVNPNEVCQHEEGETGQTLFARWILTEGRAHFQKNENDNVRMHHMIQPAEKEGKMPWTYRPVAVGSGCFYLGKNSSNDFGRMSSRSIAINAQNETPTFIASGNANVAIK